MLIDNYSYTNRMYNVHPVEKLLFAFLTMILCFVFDIYTNIAVIILMFMITVLKAKIPGKVYIKLMLIPFSFLMISVLTIIINVIGDKSAALISLDIFEVTLGITPKGISTAVTLFFRTLAVVSCLYFLVLTTPVVDIIDILKKLKIPSLFLELLQLTYRLIFVLFDAAGEVYTSQNSRLGYATLENSYRSLGLLISSLFIKSYKDSQDLYVALEARCYNGELKVISKDYRFCYRNLIFIVLIELVLISTSILLRR
ncbi:cobalt ECF transporter T component CbiQ [Thermoanaerobacterium butyriciformans]|uniref:Cobalt/nickel transport system permease protein n=1 Tax=Thermoanaerobacterium butyriciformans TaxID=1702242 RepID=A0ABS4NFB7_9THEO|nr:cobalt ECF transporter T component CbiQ [Thermoanaerobacterium butyriciformans]MBP2072366.1 cobalt/nickel transport system permease protein [Thermoanaerobacterium butyriciformans]